MSEIDVTRILEKVFDAKWTIEMVESPPSWWKGGIPLAWVGDNMWTNSSWSAEMQTIRWREEFGGSPIDLMTQIINANLRKVHPDYGMTIGQVLNAYEQWPGCPSKWRLSEEGN